LSKGSCCGPRRATRVDRLDLTSAKYFSPSFGRAHCPLMVRRFSSRTADLRRRHVNVVGAGQVVVVGRAEEAVAVREDLPKHLREECVLLFHFAPADLEMRSCLRRPLAPGSSMIGAILVARNVFFFHSAMVIVPTWIVLRKGFSFPGWGVGFLCRPCGHRRSC